MTLDTFSSDCYIYRLNYREDCWWKIPGTILYIYLEPFSDARRMQPGQLHDFMDYIDDRIRREALSAGGLNKETPKNWSPFWVHSGYYFVTKENTRWTHLRRLRYFEILSGLKGLEYCSQNLDFQEANWSLWRNSIPIGPWVRNALAWGTLYVAFLSPVHFHSLTSSASFTFTDSIRFFYRRGFDPRYPPV